MSKRLIRVFAPQLTEQIPTLIGLEVNVVLLDGNTAFGRLESSTTGDLVLRDLRNHKHPLLLSAIEEIVYDERVD
jgi:hypothetical protein